METQKVGQHRASTKGQERAHSLMAAAVDLFAERDYASVTINDITERAGVTHSLVYYHFASKEDLFNQSITHLIKNTIDSYRSIRGRHDHPVELIEDWFANNVKLSRTLRKLVKIMFEYCGPLPGSPSVSDAITAFYHEEHRVLEENVTKGMELGLFDEVDATRVAAFVSTHIDGIFYDSFIRDDEGIERAMNDLKWVLWRVLGYDRQRHGARQGLSKRQAARAQRRTAVLLSVQDSTRPDGHQEES